MTGCANQTTNALDDDTETPGEDKLTIVASLFPHYDFARAIAGDYATVTLILPPGIESHAYEPTPKDIIKITESDVFLYTSETMEPWAHALIESIDPNRTHVIDMSTGIELMAANHEEDTEDKAETGTETTTEEDHEEGEYDPHYWLDPNNAIIMVESITTALVEAMPENQAIFEANAAELISALETLDRDFTTAFDKTQSKTILSGGHFAFGYFAKRYGLDNMSPYVGFSPDAEPTPKRIADLIDTIESTKAKAIFFEELIDPRVATIISEEAGVEMLLLHGAHNISKDELTGGITYIEIMKGNLERLKIGLGYVE
jgi:zinc transport system substrate-binding protein